MYMYINGRGELSGGPISRHTLDTAPAALRYQNLGAGFGTPRYPGAMSGESSSEMQLFGFWILWVG